MISVVICTKGRQKSFYRLISDISIQTLQPDKIVVIEDVTNTKYALKNRIAHFFKNKKIQIICKSVRYKNIALSRNESLKYFKSGFIIWLDDDISLDATIFARGIQILKKHKDYTGIAGKYTTNEKNILSRFTCDFYNEQVPYGDEQHVLVKSFGFGFVILRHNLFKIIAKEFDSTFSVSEDTDLSLSGSEMGAKLYLIPKLIVTHNFHRENIISFMARFVRYTTSWFLISLKHKTVMPIDKYLPRRKIHMIFYPIYVLRLFVDSVSLRMKQRFLPAELLLAAILYELAFLIGCFMSPLGRLKFKNVVYEMLIKA